MKTSNLGWQIRNGSGWNHHKTADVLKQKELPEIPTGYGVLVAPISDKPYGLRCALVKVLLRKESPVISLRGADGQPFSSKGMLDLDRHMSLTTHAEAVAYLTELGFTDMRGPDGVTAEIEMCDDGCDGEADSWAYDAFGLESERIYSCKVEQQNEDSSDFFISKMRDAIKQLPQKTSE